MGLALFALVAAFPRVDGKRARSICDMLLTTLSSAVRYMATS